jgi:hypothetical protein
MREKNFSSMACMKNGDRFFQKYGPVFLKISSLPHPDPHELPNSGSTGIYRAKSSLRPVRLEHKYAARQHVAVAEEIEPQ